MQKFVNYGEKRFYNLGTRFSKLMGQNPEQFPEPTKFIPERWIEDKKTINPFSVRNFSHGPRMCIGKRFAELEIQVAVAKLLQVTT
jgi:cytochrome P450